jgi:NitT/TauT family transport system substrate-binding protein
VEFDAPTFSVGKSKMTKSASGKAISVLGKLFTATILSTISMLSNANATDHVTLGYGSADAIYGPWFYAQDKGFFSRHGLDSTIVFFDSGTKGVQALVGQSVDIMAADGNALVNAKLAGVNVVFVGTTMGHLTGNVYTVKEITSPAELKGKKWGISSFGSEADIAARLALKSFGLTETDVTLVQLGNQGNRFGALEAGQIQVTTFLPPVSAKAEAAGFRKLAQLPDLAPDFFSVGPAVTSDTAAQRRPMVKAFLEALGEATAAYKKDRESSIAIISKYLKSNEKDAAAAWDYYAPLAPIDFRPSPKSFQIYLEHSTNPRATNATINDFFDLSILDELEKEGFFKRLM